MQSTLSPQKSLMPPTQTLRLAAVTLLLTAGVPLLPVRLSAQVEATSNPLLPAVAQTFSDRKGKGDREASRETNRLVELEEFRSSDKIS